MTKRNKKRNKQKPHPQPDHYKGEHDTPNDTHVRGGIEIARSPSLVDEHNAERKEDATQAERRYGLEKRTLIVLAVYTGITLILAILNGIVINDSRKHFAKDQRPYIWLGNDLGKPGLLPNGQVYWGQLLYQNYGKTPASSTFLNLGIQLGDNALSKDRVFAGPDKPIPPLPQGKVDFTTSLSIDRISQSEFDRLFRSDSTIVVYGRFRYTDTSDGQYESGFCFMHITSSPTPMYCPDPKDNYIK